MICKNEMRRFLTLAVERLSTFCDEIRVLDDGSTDGSYEWLQEQEGVSVLRNVGPAFFEHEGQARQRLLDWTLAAQPSHVLAIDADEFVSDGYALRGQLASSGVWTLSMEEVWKAAPRRLYIRADGGWKPHPVPICYAVPPNPSGPVWRIHNRKLACGREPVAVRQMALQRRGRGMTPSGVSIFHFGWTRVFERVARYERYAEHDQGNFHAAAHLRSILWPDEKVRLLARPWPADFPRKEIMEVVSR